jgi:outer membrane protein assembly factor BamE (lipoprotein component of BamABCDE complex)
MKRLMLLMTMVVLAASLAGCNACRRAFNRGDRCDECPPPDCAPGMPRSTLMVPGGAPVMTGPVEIMPAG